MAFHSIKIKKFWKGVLDIDSVYNEETTRALMEYKTHVQQCAILIIEIIVFYNIKF